jgi:hypothetical protein
MNLDLDTVKICGNCAGEHNRTVDQMARGDYGLACALCGASETGLWVYSTTQGEPVPDAQLVLWALSESRLCGCCSKANNGWSFICKVCGQYPQTHEETHAFLKPEDIIHKPWCSVPKILARLV